MHTVTAYGLRRAPSGRTLIVQSRKAANGLRSQRISGGFFSAEMAELVARARAEKEGVPFVGYKEAK